MITITSLTYQPDRSSHEPPYRYNRVPVDTFTLIAGHGIEGDFKAGRNPRRQLNIMDADMVNQLRSEGYKTAPGELGEQMVIAELDVMSLQSGDRLHIGDAIIEITKPREPCDWFELIQDKPYQEAEGRVGVLAAVIAGGIVRLGDGVRVVQKESSTT